MELSNLCQLKLAKLGHIILIENVLNVKINKYKILKVMRNL